MPNWSGGILTTKGQALQAKVDAGQTTLTLTKMKIGSGVLPNGQSLQSLNDLIVPEMNVPISGVSANANISTIVGVITNTGLANGFNVRELGVYAQDPTLGEILYAITTDSAPDYLPPEGGAVTVSSEFSYNIVVSNAANVTAILNPSGLVTVSILQQHKTATILDHPDNSVTDAKIGNRTITDTTVAASGAGTLSNLLSKLGYMIKAITGKTAWYTLPAITLEALNGKFEASAGHKHSGAVGDAPLIGSTGIADDAVTAAKLGASACDDTAIGNRTITDTTAASATADTLTGLLSKLGNMIKNITGKANWYTAPTKTLEQLNNEKAPITSPAFTGIPTVPTATAGTNNTQIANTAFIATAIANLVASSPAALDTINELATALGNDPNFATTMTNALAAKAPLVSPSLTGVPTAPTATAGTNTTQLATTSFVQAALTGSNYDAAHLFANNGYQKLSNGLIIQWGFIDATTSTVAVVFPIAFPRSCFNVTLGLYFESTSNKWAPYINSGPTTTGFNAYTENTNGNFYWFAIGY